MSLRCGCPDEADDIVFGEMHRCTAEPKPPLDPPRLIPSWVFTVPTETPCSSPRSNHGDGRGCEDDNCPRHGGPTEPRYMETLDADERGGH